MKLKTVTLEYLSQFKSTSTIALTCDSCQELIHRQVKEVRRCIKNNNQTAFCSNICQGKVLKINYTHTCKNCNITFSNKNKNSLFCTRNCSSSYNNTNIKRSDETKQKISNKLKGSRVSKTPNINSYKYCELEYSRLFTCKCKNCEFKGSYKQQQKYCNNCSKYYSSNGRAKYQFTFNVYNYPELFDLSIINEFGWRKTKGTDININGVSRDHKVSVHDAILYNYDPYYIKHPLNCTLMIHKDNQSKGTNSSITYTELVCMVDDYDSKFGGPSWIQTNGVSG